MEEDFADGAILTIYRLNVPVGMLGRLLQATLRDGLSILSEMDKTLAPRARWVLVCVCHGSINDRSGLFDRKPMIPPGPSSSAAHVPTIEHEPIQG